MLPEMWLRGSSCVWNVILANWIIVHNTSFVDPSDPHVELFHLTQIARLICNVGKLLCTSYLL